MTTLLQKCRDSGRWLRRGVRLLPQKEWPWNFMMMVLILEVLFVAIHNYRYDRNKNSHGCQPERAAMQLLADTNLQKLADNDGKPLGLLFEFLATNSTIILCHCENDKIMLQLRARGLRDGVHAESGSEHGEFAEPFLLPGLFSIVQSLTPDSGVALPLAVSGDYAGDPRNDKPTNQNNGTPAKEDVSLTHISIPIWVFFVLLFLSSGCVRLLWDARMTPNDES